MYGQLSQRLARMVLLSLFIIRVALDRSLELLRCAGGLRTGGEALQDPGRLRPARRLQGGQLPASGHVQHSDFAVVSRHSIVAMNTFTLRRSGKVRR